jgi:hypothetical protein
MLGVGGLLVVKGLQEPTDGEILLPCQHFARVRIRRDPIPQLRRCGGQKGMVRLIGLRQPAERSDRIGIAAAGILRAPEMTPEPLRIMD